MNPVDNFNGLNVSGLKDNNCQVGELDMGNFLQNVFNIV